ncbi:aldehyde dehydrogenase family protein [Lysobacter sp. H23M47]|uniref:aldehyde dehydrogenase family protein n=1 Tax=Lysobacter sp. H23M47 TaxID=2781024 RepID=UPI00188174B6|nr:aldehyde dehydrogenase family protein [Lysobacter sp. H23M47]QOW24467.1 aldehyde dehydrogenase family protein [Lysobacter sp. H23M47]
MVDSTGVTASAVETIPLRDPSTGECDGQLVVVTKEEVAGIAQRLRAAQTDWAARDVGERCQALLDMADALERHREPMVEALLRDTGRWQESLIEVDSTVGALRRWAADAPALLQAPEPVASSIGFLHSRQNLVPYPLVGVISPWNFPLLLSLIDAIPALAAGCAVLCKPSEVTSRFASVLDEVMAQVPALQPVFAVVTGDGRTGEAVIGAVDTICFTGSVRTGRRVGEACAARFIPCSLELGGKDPALVLADADPVRSARAIAWGGFVNGGQSCMSIERVYVDAKIAEPFIAALVEQAKALKLTHPDPREGQIGPIISDAQIAIVREQLADAKARGARALAGGELVEHGGTWCPPTVLVDVDESMPIAREESFATILPVMVVANEEEAIARANDSIFGLSAAVFSGDTEHAVRVGARLHAGGVSINDACLTGMIHTAEKQSFKQSGLGGSRMGSVSIRRFLRSQAVLVNSGVDDPWWFPANP